MKRAPVQGDWALKQPAGTISWEEHEQAWRAYDAKWNCDQSAERIAERGGFGHEELEEFLGHKPTTFEAYR